MKVKGNSPLLIFEADTAFLGALERPMYPP